MRCLDRRMRLAGNWEPLSWSEFSDAAWLRRATLDSLRRYMAAGDVSGKQALARFDPLIGEEWR